MKVAHAEQHVLGSHGLTETKAFHIRTNAHAFKLLSSGLYSDKIAAVLREIGCNASDAHIEYGCKDEPIIVKLPNRIDNQFYIRDMGPGLSHDDVMNLYTTYFASTKQNSNDFTGAFGLGSKSPFSYTDSFTVESVHNGIKRTYSAYLNNEGSPTIAKLTEAKADADWPHGVQIGFPVKVDDFGTFEQRAKNIYRWFRVTPKILGATAVMPVTAKYIEPTGLFEYHPGNTNGHSWAVVMGNVFYPVDLSKLNIRKDRYGTAQSITEFAHSFNGIVLKLKIGEVQVAASREELQYDDASTKVLKAQIEKVLKIIGEDMAVKLRAAKTWAEKCTARDTSKMWGAEFWGSQWGEFFKLLGYADAHTLAGMATNEYVSAPADMGKNSFARVMTPSRGYRKSVNQETVRNGMWDDGPGVVSGRQATIKLHEKTKVYWGEKTLAIVRIKSLFDSGVAQQVLLFTPDKVMGKVVLDAQLDAEKTAKELGIDVVEDIADVPLPQTYVPSPKKKYKKKGAVLPPLPSQSIRTRANGVTRGFVNQDIATLPATWHNFMVRSAKSGWARSDRIRVFETTAEKDLMLEETDWDNLWQNAGNLAALIQAPFVGYVEVTANDAKKFDLLKRGWKTTHALIKEWLEDATTRDAVVKAAANWRPSMGLSEHHNSGWAGELVWIRHNYKDIFKEIKGVLSTKNLLTQVEQIHETSIKHGSQAGLREPKVLVAYRALAMTYNLTPITVTKTGNYVSVEDFDKAITTKYPATQIFDHRTLRSVIEHHPQKVEGFLKLVLS